MQNAIKNTETKMVAVIGLEINIIEEIINENKLISDEVCEIANDNCPGQIILSGTKGGIDFISEKLKNTGARSIINLKVSAPFHCSLMKSASIKMERNLEKINFRELKSKFISNVTANYEKDPKLIKNLLIEQIYSRVRWRESIIKSTNNTNFIVEIGSGKVLTGMNKRIDRNYESLNVSNLEEADIFLKIKGNHMKIFYLQEQLVVLVNLFVNCYKIITIFLSLDETKLKWNSS